MTIGQNIKKIRKEKGITQRQLGEMTGIATITIQQYEANKYKPKIEQLKKIANALDVTLDVFIGEIKKTEKKGIEFFMPMIPPTKTYQEKKVEIIGGKPVFYEPPELKSVRVKLEAHLTKHIPSTMYTSGIRLVVKWLFPRGKHPDGAYRISRPDTDNLNKMLKDIMTKLKYWQDDALVASEIIEKFWAEIPGIYIKIEELEE